MSRCGKTSQAIHYGLLLRDFLSAAKSLAISSWADRQGLRLLSKQVLTERFIH
jgi:hypothetical protein